MQPSQTRLICRAHNRFTPSIALWQHFVGPSRPHPHQRRLASAATEQSEVEIARAEKPVEQPPLRIIKVTTAKGEWHPSKAEASIVKNARLQYHSRQASLTEPERLLATARAAYKVAEDYEGVAVKPMVNSTPVKESTLPWCLKPEELTISRINRYICLSHHVKNHTLTTVGRLNMEIESFHEYTRPNRFENIARKHLIEQVRNHVRDRLPDYALEVFGSERTGIAFATSDIDFRLMRQSQISDPAEAKLPPTPEERRKAIKDLQYLYHETLSKHKAYMLAALRYARYPLISVQDRQSGLDIQIVLSNDTSVSRVVMQGYMEQYPYLRQLYYVVKTMFDVRGLSDVFRGGFGSYSLFMMIVASIKHHPHPRKDAAGALVNFLKFWRDFDTTKQGISIEPLFLFNKADQPVVTDTVKSKLEEGTTRPLPEYMLSLRDPADETNDLGRKGIAIKHVQATLKELSNQLEFDMKVNTRPSLLGPLVGTSYMLNHARRRRLNSYGKLLMRQMQTTLAAKAKAVRDAEKGGEDSKAGNKQIEEETTKQRLAREERDKGWQRLVDERNGRLQLQAERSSVLEHGEAMASILGMPAVEEEAQTQDDSAAEGPRPIEYTPAALHIV
ncbi:hypothetical protein EJ02DRAFT_34877 [Clathrospora elynae]|uniref:Poly(A) RNA polymerase mitochondrial-like central palm domain-containing protein n=1 Tax=Clathrospora elynae TaxID=706981 RepID=A0A6A5T0W7_9PLEO|nr:hypothetical protein EJ02DRAFT_34877 [Clathrospora elynae]